MRALIILISSLAVVVLSSRKKNKKNKERVSQSRQTDQETEISGHYTFNLPPPPPYHKTESE